jgi:hypothetical protein
VPGKSDRKTSYDPSSESPADRAARAIIEQLLRDIDEAIADCERERQREEEEAAWREPGPEPMEIAQREIRASIVAACRQLMQTAIDQRRDPRSWFATKMDELLATFAEKYLPGYFDLDKILADVIARSLGEWTVMISIPPHSRRAQKKSHAAANFEHSPDYRSIRFRGNPYSLTRNQAAIVKRLHEAYEAGTPVLGKEELLRTIEAETSRVQDSFKHSPLWGNLIIANRVPRGTYSLNLD